MKKSVGQATTEYILMLAVVLGVLIGVGMMYNEEFSTLVVKLKKTFRERILSGAFEGREGRGEALQNDEEPSQTIPRYQKVQPRPSQKEKQGSSSP